MRRSAGGAQQLPALLQIIDHCLQCLPLRRCQGGLVGCG